MSLKLKLTNGQIIDAKANKPDVALVLAIQMSKGETFAQIGMEADGNFVPLQLSEAVKAGEKAINSQTSTKTKVAAYLAHLAQLANAA